jgi:hypothetical protein
MKNTIGLAILVSLFGCAPLQYGTFQGQSSGVIFHEETAIVPGPFGPQRVVVARTPVIQATAYGPRAMDQAGRFADHARDYHIGLGVVETYRNWGPTSWYTGPNMIQPQPQPRPTTVASNGGVTATAPSKASDKERKAHRIAMAKACVEAGMDLKDCKKQIDEQEQEAAPATNPNPAPATQPSQAPVQTAPANPPQQPTPQAAPAPPVAAPTVRVQVISPFVIFRSDVETAQNKDQLAHAFGKAVDHANSPKARKLFEDQATEIRNMSVAQFSATKEYIKKRVETYHPYLEEK